MGSVTDKPHAVLVPYPAQGHVNPFMRLAKLLHTQGFHITFVNTEFNHKRLIRSKGPESVRGFDDFKFETIPDGLPPSDKLDATQDVPMLCDSTRKTCLVPFKELLMKLNSSTVSPPVSCVIADGVMTFGIRAAKDLGIPGVQFWTASACSFIGYLHYRELVNRGIVPFKNEDYLKDGTLDEPVDWVRGMKNVRLRDLPSFLRTTDPNDIMFDFLGEEAQNCLNAPAIIFNTFDELEKEALNTVISTFNFQTIFPIGPLHLLTTKQVSLNSKVSALNSSLWKPDSEVLQWLDKKEPRSVVFVSYGSITTMSETHFIEFAWGLAGSGHHFVWIVRPDVLESSRGFPGEGFLEEIKDRGLLANWCEQDKVLNHPSVGAFLSHCGWNSCVEGISAGLPVISWPFFADQQTNSHYLAASDKWGMGVEMNDDVKREEVAKLVQDMLVGEKGEEARVRARDWKKKAEEATNVGGSSYNNFNTFIHYIKG